MNYNELSYQQDADVRVSRVLKGVYLNMTLGLLITALTAWFCQPPSLFSSFIAANSWSIWALIIAEFAIVIGVSAGINKLSTPVAMLLFFVFAVINGMMLSPILLAYTKTSIVKTFIITATVFGAMSIYGLFTNRDLTRMGNILFMALIGLIIASLINIFTRSTTLEWIISGVGVLIFVGLTAWDTQQIKRMSLMLPEAGTGRLAVLGALSLYLDFINLFLYLLRFFGNSRD